MPWKHFKRLNDNMKKTGFNSYIYDFSTVYKAIATYDLLDIHKYLMKKNNIVLMKIFSFVKKVFVLGLTIFSNIANALE